MELMTEVFNTFPKTCMSLLAIIILAGVYKFITTKMIKVGPVELDDVEDKPKKEGELEPKNSDGSV